MPKFPSYTITREEAINQILSSIAMEELALSHILNAEGEKIQYVLGTLHVDDDDNRSAVTPTPSGASIEDVLKVNDSVRMLLETVTFKQMLLKSKMSAALEADVHVQADNSEEVGGGA